VSAARRRLGAVAIALGLLAGVAAALQVAPGRTAPRDPGLADFALDGPGGRVHSVASFPPDSVLVIYFGYSTCLRACPVALDSIAAALESLGPQRAAVRPLFVDMDSDRAALVNLPLYMQTFGPDFLGLSGTSQAVARAVRAFGVEVERTSFSADPLDYAMTHVSPIFVMRPGDAQPLRLAPTSAPDAIAAALREALT
jgi:protein SCO1/2